MADIIQGPNSEPQIDLSTWVDRVYRTISVEATPMLQDEENGPVVVGGVCRFEFDRNQCGEVLVQLIEAVKKGELGGVILP